MRKVWITKRKGIPGVFVEWYDDINRRRSKYFSPKNSQFAKNFQNRKFVELNQDIHAFEKSVDLPWSDFVEQYLSDKKSIGLSEQSLYDIRHTCNTFGNICSPQRTRFINRAMLLKFLTSLRLKPSHKTGNATSPNTINKHFRNLRALFNWGLKYNYLPKDLDVKSILADLARLRRVQLNRTKQNDKTSKSQISMPILQLITLSENHTIEFKETLEYDVKTNKNSKDVLLSSLKTIAGFLNSNGGTLLIGINDSGEIKGIERDLSTMKHSNNDRFEQKIRNCLRDRFSPQPLGKVKISFEKFAEGTICRVDVRTNKKIVLLDDVLYVREGNITQKLEGRVLIDWVQQKVK